MDYNALKTHFNNKKYDYFKYNGKVRLNEQSFSERNDAYFFHKLSSMDNYVNRIVSHLIVNKNSWVKTIIDDTKVYTEWKKRTDSLTRFFKSELENYLDPNLVKNIKAKEGTYPLIVSEYMSKRISLETFAIFCEITKSYKYLEESYKKDVYIPDLIHLAKKYHPFLNYDRKKFVAIVKEFSQTV